MILIYILYAVLSGLVVFLVFYSSLNKLIKAIALTAMLLLGLTTQDYYVSQLGKPIDAFPVGDFVYVHHVPQDDFIYLWIWTEDKGNKLHVIPYSAEVAKALQEGKEKASDGAEQEGEFTESGNNNSPGLIMDDWRGPNTEYNK